MGASTQPPASSFAQGLMYAGGAAGIFALLVAFSAVTGHGFEIASKGGGRGIPLPSSWFHAALFAGIGLALWFAGRRWDAPRFAALRSRRPWLVPVVVGTVIAPASLVLIFVLVS
jgi:hypothetical protein